MSDVAAPAPVTNGASAAPTPAPPETPTKATSSPAAAAAPKPNGKAPAKTPPPAAAKAPETPAGKEEELFEVPGPNGEKRKYTREQVLRRLAREDASDQFFRKGGEAVKKTNAILGMLTKDTKAALTHAGVDVRAFAEQVLQEAVEEAELTPEQRQHKADAQELERLRGFEKQQKELGEKQVQEKKDLAYFAQLEKAIIPAAQAAGLEGTPENLHRIAETGLEWLELGLPISPEHLVAEVKEREDAAFGKLEQKVLGGLKGEALAKRLGPAVVEEVLRWSVEALRGGPPAAEKPPETAPPAQKPSQYITDGEFRRKHGF